MKLTIRLDLDSAQSQANLLQGLDYWIHLGLLSDTLIRELALSLAQPIVLEPTAQNLPAEIPQVQPEERRPLQTDSLPANTRQPNRPETNRPETSLGEADSVRPTVRPTTRPTVVVRSQPSSFAGRLIQSLVAEISVIWLLFLGVFLVVVSSGVLAASLWQAFSAVGQYAILFAYTLAFWGASTWAKRQPRLQMTAKMLNLTTLLIVPVNFWMMDGLGVATTFPGMVLGGIATVILSGLPFALMTQRVMAGHLLALSWLNWGWGIGAWPLLATYLGILGSAAHLLYRDRLTSRAPSASQPPLSSLLSFDVLAVAVSTLLLLIRCLWAEQIPIAQLGLAMGLWGWLVVQLTVRKPEAQAGVWLGWGLLLLGWAVTVTHQPPWQALGVSGLCVTALTSQPRAPRALLELTHGMGLVAIASTIDYTYPDLSTLQWAYLCGAGAIGQWLLSLSISPNSPWRSSTWIMGLILSGISYLGLLSTPFYDQPHHQGWAWLLIVLTLTAVANHPRAVQPKAAVGFTMVALLLQTIWLVAWPIAVASFTIGTLCMALNSRIWRNDLTALFTVASAIAAISSASMWIFNIRSSDSSVFTLWALIIGGLWLAQRIFEQSPGDLARYYARATQVWHIGLLIGLLLTQTLIAVDLYTQPWSNPPTVIAPGSGNILTGIYSPDLLRHSLAALTLVAAMLLERLRKQAQGWQLWSMAWVAELLILLGVATQQPNTQTVAVFTLALALITQLIGEIWGRRNPQQPESWHTIPVAYAALGFTLGHIQFTANTGLYSLATALILMTIGRRQTHWHPLSYVGLISFSVGAYELLLHRLLQAQGGHPGDALTLMAGLALCIALLQRFVGSQIASHLRLQPEGLGSIAHIHWGLGTFMAALATFNGLSHPQGIWLWAGVALGLAGYALTMGNRYLTYPEASPEPLETWTTCGLVTTSLTLAYARFELFPNLTFLLNWGALLACLLGFGLYCLPWQTWGWPERPWRLAGLWLPILTLSITLTQVKTQNLLLVGAFYAWCGKQFDRTRLSYVSVALLNWALWRYFNTQGWLSPLWINTLLGLSILYVAQVEPSLQSLSMRNRRHGLRVLASGLVGLSALYQTEISTPLLTFAGLTLLLALGLILVGLTLKVRAFLFVGTATFVAQVFRILWLLIGNQALLLWAIGIVLGLMLIWIAATFESRRSQITNWLESWSSALETWD
jgi:hypothetical protein